MVSFDFVFFFYPFLLVFGDAIFFSAINFSLDHLSLLFDVAVRRFRPDRECLKELCIKRYSSTIFPSGRKFSKHSATNCCLSNMGCNPYSVGIGGDSVGIHMGGLISRY